MAHIRIDKVGAVGEITLTRPEVLNAASPEMIDGLLKFTAQLEHDPAIRCVVLRAEGDHFMAGGDVKSFHKSLTEDRAAHLAGFEQRVLRGHQLFYNIRRMPKPVIVAVQGAVAGLGLSLVLAADIAIGSEDAFFSLAYRHIGLTVDGLASYLLPRIVGERKALELALLGERVTASQALELTILNRLVPRATLADQTDALAQKLAQGPTKALGITKRLFHASLESTWDAQSHREAEGIAEAVASADHLEGVKAFVEKRKPTFTGR